MSGVGVARDESQCATRFVTAAPGVTVPDSTELPTALTAVAGSFLTREALRSRSRRRSSSDIACALADGDGVGDGDGSGGPPRPPSMGAEAEGREEEEDEDEGAVAAEDDEEAEGDEVDEKDGKKWPPPSRSR